MKGPARRKCLCCKEFYRPDHRNLRHQRYCSKPACHKESKGQSQRRWLQRPENENYFRGPDNSRRVKEWRKRRDILESNPGWEPARFSDENQTSSVSKAAAPSAASV
jgi:hypothetical protein